MKIRTKFAGMAALAAATAFAGLAPADAALVGTTNVTFTVGSGALAITTPASAALSEATPLTGGTSVTGLLGDTTVTDARGSAAGAWAVTGTSTDFTDTTKTIPKSAVSVFSGASTASSGVVVFVPTLVAAPVSMAGSGGVVASATGVVGASSVTYNPTMTVAITAATVAGDYAGVFTQTVA